MSLKSDYKIETKPTIWHFILQRGVYSDREEDHHFLRANDREEAWHLFKEYWDDRTSGSEAFEWTRGNLLIYIDQDGREVERFKPQKWWGYGDEDDEPNWDREYGQAWEVALSQLDVVEFIR